MASTLTLIESDWTGRDTTVGEIEHALARLRDSTAETGAQPNQRTSVMTHIAWVPATWREAATDALAGMAERHPSRTLLLFPAADERDGLDARVEVRCFPVGERAICGEVIELTLRGNRVRAPASIVLPLLISDLPVFCRWRGEPPFGGVEFEQLVEVVDRLIVDTSEWTAPRREALAPLFQRVAVSDLAWARTEPWRAELATYWPSIREQEIHIEGPSAEAGLLRGWLQARLGRQVRAVGEAASLAVRLGGERVPDPRGPQPTPSDLLSAELDRFGRDRVYEEAAAAVA